MNLKMILYVPIVQIKMQFYSQQKERPVVCVSVHEKYAFIHTHARKRQYIE